MTAIIVCLTYTVQDPKFSFILICNKFITGIHGAVVLYHLKWRWSLK